MKAFVAARITEPWLDELRKHYQVEQSFHFSQGNLNPDQLAEKMKDCHLAVIENDTVTAEVLAACPHLFAIVDFRGTVTNVDLEAATRQGVVVIHTPGRNADAVADFTVGMMIACARNVLPGIDAIRSNGWVEKGTRAAYVSLQGYDLPGKTVGLIGLGAIGRLVAKRLSGFDVRLVGHDPFVDAQTAAAFGVEWLPLEQVLSRAHIVSLHVPLNDSTRGMIGEAQLRCMQPGAYLVNTARADVVDSEALLRCLQEGRIAGAALDVFSQEPIGSDDPLANLPNVICTPHLGGATRDVVENQSRMGVKCLLDFMHGGKPAHCVNPQAIDHSRQKMIGQRPAVASQS
jgi:phosphoglycerate dehydrogenase-like enzyme